MKLLRARSPRVRYSPLQFHVHDPMLQNDKLARRRCIHEWSGRQCFHPRAPRECVKLRVAFRFHLIQLNRHLIEGCGGLEFRFEDYGSKRGSFHRLAQEKRYRLVDAHANAKHPGPLPR